MIYAYARCSTNESKQDVDRQVRELKAAGAEQFFLEYEHGDSRTKKNLEQMFSVATEGDTIMTLEVSRLSRSTQQLCDLIDLIKAKRLRLVILGSITIDCRNGEIDAMSRAFIQIAGVFAELELSMIRSRVKSGMAAAAAKGVQIGRRPTTKEDIPPAFYRHYPGLKSGNLNISEMARLCSITRPTVYKYKKLIEL